MGRTQDKPQPPVPCWRCGCAEPIPTLEQQIDLAIAVHRTFGEPYLWEPQEWAALYTLLEDGDIIELCRNSFLRMLNPDAQGILIWRARTKENIRIDRRQLKAEPPEPRIETPKPKPAAPPMPDPKSKVDDDFDPF